MKTFHVTLAILAMLTGCGNHTQASFAMPKSEVASPKPSASPTDTKTATGSKKPTSKPDDSSARPNSVSSERPSEPKTENKPEVAPAKTSPELKEAPHTGQQLEIRLYRSFGNEGLVHIRGRVMKPEPQPPVNADDTGLTNFLRNLDNLSVAEKAGFKVDLTIEGQTVRLVSDKEGMLLSSTDLFGKLTPGMHTITARLVSGQNAWAPLTETKVMIHPADDESLGYVSDIDDTIKISDVTNKLEAVRRLLFLNEKTAEPVPGTAALYQVLEAHDGKADGDFHYLSGSPLNLAAAIYNFLDLKGFPRGSVDLKKWGFQKGDDNPLQQTEYKQERLRLLFKTYPKRLFICFGDSGEKDPEIYRQIASEFPGRIKAIFINNVTKAKADDARFAGEHLTNNAGEAAAILQRAGLINAADVAKVKAAL